MIDAPYFSHRLSYDPGLAGITLPVTLSTGTKTVAVDVKLDTGASACVFSRSHGEALGLAIEQGLPQRMVTVTGRFDTFRHELTLTVADYAFDIGAYFAADAAFRRDVVGRHGFLDRLNIGFVDYEGVLFLGRYGDMP